MTFKELNLSAPLLRAVSEAGYSTPSPIQAAAIPPVLAGRDLMGCAQTGTGKTAAFALPMLDRLAAEPARKKGAIRALILTPTRELALQIGENFEQYGKYRRLRSAVIFGGVGQAPQVEALKNGVDILIACPGRLNDLIGQGYIDLSYIEIFVLDEADRMLDMGFVHDVKKVIAKLPPKRQNLMFSATMPKEIEQLAAGILREPAFVKVDPVSSTVERINQSIYRVEKGNKRFLLPWLIKTLDPPVVNALVFSRTKHGADKIARDLQKQGITAAAIHGNKSQSARVAALEGFKAGKTQVLVATDIAARGIDINELSHVFNYDLPEVPETYVHRIGRTARAGADGTAVSFCSPEEEEYLSGIEKLNRRKILVVADHPWSGVPAPAKAPVTQKAQKNSRTQKTGEPKAAKPAAPAKAKTGEKKSATAQQPKTEAKIAQTETEEIIMDENTTRRRGENGNGRRARRSRRDSAQQSAPRGSNTQPKFDPHFVSAPEQPPLHPAKKPAAPAAKAAQQAVAPAAKNQSGARGRRERGSRAQQSASQTPNAGAASQAQPQTARGAHQSAAGHARNAETVLRQSRRTSAARDEDAGLVLISRRPPQQKFSNFEEYMEAHGGATAPIEDHSFEE